MTEVGEINTKCCTLTWNVSKRSSLRDAQRRKNRNLRAGDVEKNVRFSLQSPYADRRFLFFCNDTSTTTTNKKNVHNTSSNGRIKKRNRAQERKEKRNLRIRKKSSQRRLRTPIAVFSFSVFAIAHIRRRYIQTNCEIRNSHINNITSIQQKNRKASVAGGVGERERSNLHEHTQTHAHAL